MLAYIVRRVLLMIPTLFLVSVVSFALLQLPPGDYLTEYAAQLSSQGESVDQDAIAALRERARVIFVDFHAEATSEKVAMGRYLDGRVSAVLGTHTHGDDSRTAAARDPEFIGASAFAEALFGHGQHELLSGPKFGIALGRKHRFFGPLLGLLLDGDVRLLADNFALGLSRRVGLAQIGARFGGACIAIRHRVGASAAIKNIVA